ncbi:hypothetical protein BGW37DRAFT_520444 [Umbelopsis sp. PMI_123]|nr:hypothetical protein BGW37DRAFT_520444 [Umbelopsis sp. PMI_123]
MSSVKLVSQLRLLSTGPSYTSPHIDHKASTAPAPASDQGTNPRRRQEKGKQRQFDDPMTISTDTSSTSTSTSASLRVPTSSSSATVSTASTSASSSVQVPTSSSSATVSTASTSASTSAQEIWDYCIGQHDGNEDDADEMESFKQEWQRYINPITQNNTTVQAKLQRMYSLNILFTAWQCKVYTLVPIYTHDAKYIRIDTRALYELLGSTQGTGLSLVQFNARREEFFASTSTCRPDSLTGTQEHHASTICLIPTDTERENRLAEAREERFTRLFQNIQGRAGEHDLHWVGVDPGRKNVVTASKLDEDNEHWSFKLSSAQYHHRIKANERKEKKKDTQLQKAGVSEWLLESPTMKTHSAAPTLSCIQRTFASNHLHQIFNINSTRKTKH